MVNGFDLLPMYFKRNNPLVLIWFTIIFNIVVMSSLRWYPMMVFLGGRSFVLSPCEFMSVRPSSIAARAICQARNCRETTVDHFEQKKKKNLFDEVEIPHKKRPSSPPSCSPRRPFRISSFHKQSKIHHTIAATTTQILPQA